MIELARGFFDIDWYSVEFGNIRIVEGILQILLVLLVVNLVARLIWRKIRRRNWNVMPGSGYFIKPTLWQRLFMWSVRLLPIAVISLGIALILFALADPYKYNILEKEHIRSSERLELVDVSTSMAEKVNAQKESRAAILRRQHLKFLEKRRGKNDRVALWIFSSGAYLVERFIVDDDVYMMQLKNTPLIISARYAYLSETERTQFEPGQVRGMDGEGGTTLDHALDSVIEFFDRESDPKVQRKTIILFTDAEPHKYPSAQLAALRERNIVIYMIFLKRTAQESKIARRLIRELPRYGGRCYPVEDENTLGKILAEIDKLEQIETMKSRLAIIFQFYQWPLSMGVILLTLGVILALTVEVLWPVRP